MAIGVVIFLITPTPGKKYLRELGIILILGLISDIIGVGGYFIFRINMNIATSLFIISSTPLYFLLYQRLVGKRNVSAIIYMYTAIFMIFAFGNFFLIQGPHGVNSYTNTIASGSLIIMALAYFYLLTRELPAQSITQLPMFWVNTAVLIFYSGSFFLVLTTDYLINVLNSNMIIPLMIFHSIQIFHYVLIWVGLWLNREQHLAKQV